MSSSPLSVVVVCCREDIPRLYSSLDRAVHGGGLRWLDNIKTAGTRGFCYEAESCLDGKTELLTPPAHGVTPFVRFVLTDTTPNNSGSCLVVTPEQLFER